MARNNGTYTPDNETMELLSRLEQGTIDKAGMEHLRMLFSTDPDFAAFFTSWRNAIAGKKQAQQAQQAGGNQRRATTGIDQYLNSKNSSSGYSSSSRTVSPGGFKASGRDSDSMARRSGESTPENFANTMVRFRRDGKGDLIAYYGIRNNGRKYSPERLQWVLERGATGATMGKEDQAVYDAWMQASERRRQRSEQAAAMGAESKARKMANDSALAQKEKELKLRNKYDIQRANATAAFQAQLERQKDADDLALFKEENGIPQDVRLSKSAIKDITNNKKMWGYTERDEERYNELQGVLADIEVDNTLSEEDKATMTEQVLAQMDRLQKQLVPFRGERTAAQIRAEADANGGWFRNSNGEWAIRQETPEEKRTEAEKQRAFERELKEADMALKREQALQDMESKKQDAEAKRKQEYLQAYRDARKKDWDKAEDEKKAYDENYAVQPYVPDEDMYRAGLDEYNMMNGVINGNGEQPEKPQPELEEGYYEEIPLDERQPLGPNGYVAEQSQVAETPPDNGRSWTGSQRFAETMAQQSGEAPMEFEICPVCEAELMPDGICPVCGFPDENAVMAWKEQRNVQG